MYCTKCGKKVPNNSKICPYCGKPITNGQQPGQTTQPQQPAKCWRVFNNVGYNLSIAGMALFWFPIIGACLSIPGLVFACLGRKDEEHKDKQRKAFGLSLAGLILNVIVFIVLVIVIPVVAASKA